MIKELRWVAGTLESIVERCGFQFPVNRSKLLDPPPRLKRHAFTTQVLVI